MTGQGELPPEVGQRLRWPLALTLIGLFAERLARAFWPFWTVLLFACSALLLGLHEILSLEVAWALGILAILAALVTFALAVRRFRFPGRREALDRLDATLPGRPIAAVADRHAIGAGDAGSEAIWQTHVGRMTRRLDEARAVEPDLRLSRFDLFGLRYVALLCLAVGLLFGSFLKVGTLGEVMLDEQASALKSSWEGWVEPPYYTGRPNLYLNDITHAWLAVPEGSLVTIRLYGGVGDLTLHETVSGRTRDVPPASDPSQSFSVIQDGEIRINGPGGREWTMDAEADLVPEIEFAGPVTRGEGGRMEAPFAARDDYGVVGGWIEMILDEGHVDRRYGLALDPEPRDPVLLELPLTIAGDRSEFSETVIGDFSRHPWANLPVRAELAALDDAGQQGVSEPQSAILPGRRFFDPLAQAIIEGRRDLLWNRENAGRVAQVLRAVSHVPEDVFRSATDFMMLRFIVRRLEARAALGRLDDPSVEELGEALWNLAVQIEEGDLSDALARLRRAEERLAEAIQNGANEEEIADLMREFREAIRDYLRQLAEQQGEGQNQQFAEGEATEIGPQELDDLLDRLQELMEQGRMAEAAQLLEQLRGMMENSFAARGQPSPGQQAMEGLAETLREQQGLSDEAFRDLQEQRGGSQAGRSLGNLGREGSDGEGLRHGEGGQQGQGGRLGQQEGGGERSLADRQRALRQELNRQTQNLPGVGTPGGDAARESLGRAGDAMDLAEEDLRNEDFAGALENQADAIEALREGMRNLADQMAQQGQNQAGQPGAGNGWNNTGANRDPLGRDAGGGSRIGTDEHLLQGDDLQRRAREILEELRRRSGDMERSEEERDYLRRLLERF